MSPTPPVSTGAGNTREGAEDLFVQVTTALTPLRSSLLDHQLYGLLAQAVGLRTFMAHHVFAVWDYTALFQALQATLGADMASWPSARQAPTRHLLDEIRRTEEAGTAVDPPGCSHHLDRYLQAMDEVGADTATFRRFLELIRGGMPWPMALDDACVPAAAAHFVSRTMAACEQMSVTDLTATFLLGRESLIPALYRRLTDVLRLARDLPSPTLLDHLCRHLRQAEDQRGLWAEQTLQSLCGQNTARWQSVSQSARDALNARLEFWDGIAAAILRKGPVAAPPRNRAGTTPP